jgi:HEPN domain-containing protein
METRQEELAKELNITPEQLTPIDEHKVLKMMEQGVLVQLHISYWRPYTRLKEADLGIQATNGARGYIQLGKKKLLPPEMIAKIETIELRTRMALREHSLDCFWGRFVPVKAWQSWREHSDKLRKRFYEVRDEIVNTIPESITQLREIYTQMAKDAYKREEYNLNAEASQTYIDAFVSACLNRIPPAEQIGRTFNYNEVYSYIPLPGQLKAYAQGVFEEDMHRQIAQQFFEQKQEMMRVFLNEIGTGLRAMVVKVCQSVRDSIKQHGKLVPQSVTDLKGLLRKLERLNFHEDAQIAKMIEDMSQEVGKPIKERNVDSINAVLGEVLTACTTQIEEIASRMPSRYDLLELTDRPAEGSETNA